MVAANLYIGRPIDNLVVCGVKSESALHKARDHLNTIAVRHCVFTEPDLNNELTAIATEAVFGDVRKHFRKYQLLKGRYHDNTANS